MALLRLGSMFTDIRGKLGGNYFTVNKGTAAINVSPKKSVSKKYLQALNVNTQNAERVTAVVSRTWKGLSDGQRLQWDMNASTLTFYNKLNQPYTPSGYEVFCKRNMQLLSINIDQISVPKLDTTEADVSLFNVYFDTGNIIKVIYDAGVSPPDSAYAIYASYPQSNGVKQPRSAYRLIITKTTFPLTALDITDDYKNVFGLQPTVGTVFFRVEVFSTFSGIQNGSKLTKADAGFI